MSEVSGGERDAGRIEMMMKRIALTVAVVLLLAVPVLAQSPTPVDTATPTVTPTSTPTNIQTPNCAQRRPLPVLDGYRNSGTIADQTAKTLVAGIANKRIVIEAVQATSDGATTVELLCSSASFKMQLTATALEKFYPNVEMCCADGVDLQLDQSATANTAVTVRWHYE